MIYNTKPAYLIITDLATMGRLAKDAVSALSMALGAVDPIKCCARYTHRASFFLYLWDALDVAKGGRRRLLRAFLYHDSTKLNKNMGMILKIESLL